jgi:hypothetical protein
LPDGMARGYWPPRYNHLHLGGPVRAQQSGISSIQARTSSRLPTRDHLNRARRPRRRRRSRHSRSRSSHAATQPDVSRSRSRSSGPPKMNATGRDLDPRRRHPTQAAAHENPLPLGLANVPVFSCKRQRERTARPSAIASCNTLLGGSAGVSMPSGPRGGTLPVGRARVVRQDAVAEQTREGRFEAGLGSRRPRRPASETSPGGTAPR